MDINELGTTLNKENNSNNSLDNQADNLDKVDNKVDNQELKPCLSQGGLF